MVTTTPSRKLLERFGKLLREGGLLPDHAQASSLPEVVRCLIVATSEAQTEPLNTAQIRAWAATLSDLTSDRGAAVEALRQGILPALPRFLQLYETSSHDVSWSDSLIALHNFALLEEQGFPEALDRLEPADLTAIATNLARALKIGLHPAEARDAAARLAVYEPMMGPLIDAGVLTALTLFIPSVKPLNRVQQWGPDSLREINSSLTAMDMLLFTYTKTEREEELPTKDLANTNLTGWICDVLQGAPGCDAKFRDDVEQSRISALECLTSLLINATVCRQAVPNNRSMLFRVASAITSTSSVALLSAAAQVLAQALSEEDLVPPSELASLHTYDLVRHLSQVVDESRDFRDLLNVIAALQNILDPAHFKGLVPCMKKVAERLVMCSFEEQLSDFLKNPKQHFDTHIAEDGSAYPTPDDLQALEEAGKGALENTRTLLQAVGPLNVTVVPRAAPLKDGGAKRLAAVSARKGAQNVPADVIAAVTGGSDHRGSKDSGAKSKRKAGDGPADGGKRKRAATALPLGDRVQLEKEMRKAASLAAPLLSGPPLRAVLEWFNEWGSCRQRLEAELGTDVHVEGGNHRVLLQDAIENADPQACLDLLSDILMVRLPPRKQAAAAAAEKPEAVQVQVQPKVEAEKPEAVQVQVQPKVEAEKEAEAGPAPMQGVEAAGTGAEAVPAAEPAPAPREEAAGEPLVAGSCGGEQVGQQQEATAAAAAAAAGALQ